MKKIFFVICTLVTLWLYGVEPVMIIDFEEKLSDNCSLIGKAEYVDGLKGKAIALDEAFINIIQPESVTPEEGTVLFWIKPVNWDFSCKEFIFLLSATRDKEQGGRIILYKYLDASGLMFYYGNPKGEFNKTNISCNTPSPDIPKDKWSMVGISWSKTAKRIYLYINGTMTTLANISEEMIFDTLLEFTLNAEGYTPRNRQYKTLYDSLKFYDTALSHAEIENIYNKEKPK